MHRERGKVINKITHVNNYAKTFTPKNQKEHQNDYMNKNEEIKEYKNEEVKEYKNEEVKDNYKDEEVKEYKNEEVKDNYKDEEVKEYKNEEVKEYKNEEVKEYKNEEIKDNYKDEEVKEYIKNKPSVIQKSENEENIVESNNQTRNGLVNFVHKPRKEITTQYQNTLVNNIIRIPSKYLSNANHKDNANNLSQNTGIFSETGYINTIPTVLESKEVKVLSSSSNSGDDNEGDQEENDNEENDQEEDEENNNEENDQEDDESEESTTALSSSNSESEESSNSSSNNENSVTYSVLSNVTFSEDENSLEEITEEEFYGQSKPKLDKFSYLDDFGQEGMSGEGTFTEESLNSNMVIVNDSLTKDSIAKVLTVKDSIFEASLINESISKNTQEVPVKESFNTALITKESIIKDPLPEVQIKENTNKMLPVPPAVKESLINIIPKAKENLSKQKTRSVSSSSSEEGREQETPIISRQILTSNIRCDDSGSFETLFTTLNRNYMNEPSLTFKRFTTNKKRSISKIHAKDIKTLSKLGYVCELTHISNDILTIKTKDKFGIPFYCIGRVQNIPKVSNNISTTLKCSLLKEVEGKVDGVLIITCNYYIYILSTENGSIGYVEITVPRVNSVFCHTDQTIRETEMTFHPVLSIKNIDAIKTGVMSSTLCLNSLVFSTYSKDIQRMKSSLVDITKTINDLELHTEGLIVKSNENIKQILNEEYRTDKDYLRISHVASYLNDLELMSNLLSIILQSSEYIEVLKLKCIESID